MTQAEKYKAWVRTLACLVDKDNGKDKCYGRVDPHHLIARGMGGTRGKFLEQKDWSCIPACRKHHSELEQIGKSRFEKKYEINLRAENKRLNGEFLKCQIHPK